MTESAPASVRATNIPAGPAPMTATSQVFSAAILYFLAPRAAGEPEREDGHPRPGKERIHRLALVRVPEEAEEHPAPPRAAQLRAAHQTPEPAVGQEFLHARRGHAWGEGLADRPLRGDRGARSSRIRRGHRIPCIPRRRSDPPELPQHPAVPVDRPA